jgi:hypothetical protein
MNPVADPYGDAAAAFATPWPPKWAKTTANGRETPITQKHPDWIEFSIVHQRRRLKAVRRGLDRRGADARNSAGSNTR